MSFPTGFPKLPNLNTVTGMMSFTSKTKGSDKTNDLRSERLKPAPSSKKTVKGSKAKDSKAKRLSDQIGTKILSSSEEEGPTLGGHPSLGLHKPIEARESHPPNPQVGTQRPIALLKEINLTNRSELMNRRSLARRYIDVIDMLNEDNNTTKKDIFIATKMAEIEIYSHYDYLLSTGREFEKFLDTPSISRTMSSHSSPPHPQQTNRMLEEIIKPFEEGIRQGNFTDTYEAVRKQLENTPPEEQRALATAFPSFVSQFDKLESKVQEKKIDERNEPWRREPKLAMQTLSHFEMTATDLLNLDFKNAPDQELHKLLILYNIPNHADFAKFEEKFQNERGTSIQNFLNAKRNDPFLWTITSGLIPACKVAWNNNNRVEDVEANKVLLAQIIADRRIPNVALEQFFKFAGISVSGEWFKHADGTPTELGQELSNRGMLPTGGPTRSKANIAALKQADPTVWKNHANMADKSAGREANLALLTTIIKDTNRVSNTELYHFFKDAGISRNGVFLSGLNTFMQDFRGLSPTDLFVKAERGLNLDNLKNYLANWRNNANIANENTAFDANQILLVTIISDKTITDKELYHFFKEAGISENGQFLTSVEVVMKTERKFFPAELFAKGERGELNGVI